MGVTLANLLAELPEVTRASTSGALDNTKRTRAINRILEDLQDFGDWNFTRRTKAFDFIDGNRPTTCDQPESFEQEVGTTVIVTCTTSDTRGHVRSHSFTSTVIIPDRDGDGIMIQTDWYGLKGSIIFFSSTIPMRQNGEICTGDMQSVKI